MRKPRALGVAVAGLLVSIACGGSDADKAALETPARVGDRAAVEPRPFMVRGCLTGGDGRFVLTDLDPGVPGPAVAEKEGDRPAAEPQPTTESYRLVDVDGEQMRALVGQRVEVAGAVEPEQVVETREVDPQARPRGDSTTGTTGVDPRVGTTQTTRLEIGDLRVKSVRPLGEPCRSIGQP